MIHVASNCTFFFFLIICMKKCWMSLGLLDPPQAQKNLFIIKPTDKIMRGPSGFCWDVTAEYIKLFHSLMNLHWSWRSTGDTQLLTLIYFSLLLRPSVSYTVHANVPLNRNNRKKCQHFTQKGASERLARV